MDFTHKKVLITGHTGFKGCWLSGWLLNLGAHVVGISKDIPTNPAMFSDVQLLDKLAHHVADIRDLETLKELITHQQPDFVFHLAAQAIVSVSYTDSVETVS